jgi:hypothetical protein
LLNTTKTKKLLKNLKEILKGMNSMSEVSSFLAALAALGIVRAWDGAQEDRISRQEEVFVPFNLPLLPLREQLVCQPQTDSTVATSCFPTAA